MELKKYGFKSVFLNFGVKFKGLGGDVYAWKAMFGPFKAMLCQNFTGSPDPQLVVILQVCSPTTIPVWSGRNPNVDPGE